MAKLQGSNSMRVKMNIVLAAIVLIGFGGLIGRLYYLQLVDYEENRTRALRQQLRPTTIAAQRGTIYDCNMKRLAASATVWQVTLSPGDLKSDEELTLVADFLAPLLEIDREKIVARGQKKSSYYEILAPRVENDIADQITAFMVDNNINCLNLIENSKRYYPYGNLASAVLGFTSNENKGAYGLESYYEKVLAGTPGMIVSAKNAKSGNMPTSYSREYAPVDGNSLVLTIDEVIQHSLEKHLETAVVEHNVQNRATGIVMNVKTGAVLAMATKPDFNPNSPNEIDDPALRAQVEAYAADPALQAQLATAKDNAEREQMLENARKKALGEAQFLQWRNKAVCDPYEPGSVFKILTSAMALDLDVVKPTGQYFYCPGYHIVAGRRKACWKAGGHGSIDFTHAVKFSCNPAFMMVGAAIGPKEFDSYFERFGLKEPTGIDLPGEADSIFYDYKTLAKESGEELASSSFGQTFKVTPIQLCSAVCAVVNGGKLMQPYIVSQVLDPEGNVVSSTEPTCKREIITAETSETLRGILERVVGDADGSGRFAYVPGYRVGGKTGTSEKLDAKENGEVNKRISSFLGIAPANDPEICVLIMLDEPHMQNIYGSIIAAPVVGAIMAETLPYLGVETQYTEAESAALEIEVPQVTGAMVHDATAALTIAGLKYRIVGDGTTVLRQLPAQKSIAPRDATVMLYTEEQTLPQPTAVPDVVGMSAQQANRTLLNAGYNIRLEGDAGAANNPVTAQQPEAGENAEPGTVVTIYFAQAPPGEPT